jgi:putative SOS response-associated peptidase YedK
MIRGMCGCYVDKTLGPELQEHGRTLPEKFRRLTAAVDARPMNADVRPTQQVPIVVAGEDPTPRMAQWWYVPPYAKDPVAFRKQFTTFNARLEGVAASRTYAES